mmetsp:Transcript_39388/g.81781  ORF Transcript_39388/g.81781 Transcript_39388/m.81781 type:complete len:348 (-) Transcript_39388:1476-2519(-)
MGGRTCRKTKVTTVANATSYFTRTLLQAQLTVAQYLTRDYDHEYQIIHTYLASIMPTFLPTLLGVAALTVPDMNHPEEQRKQGVAATLFLQDFVIFLGRQPFTGQWMFHTLQERPETTPHYTWLWQELQKLQQRTEATQVIPPLQSMVVSLPSEKYESEPNNPLLQQQEEQHSETFEELDHDDLEAWQARADLLHQQNKALQERRDFLQALAVCAQHWARENDDDRARLHTDIMKSFQDVVRATPSIAPSLETWIHQVLTLYTMYQGRDPETGQVMHRFMGTDIEDKLQQAARSVASTDHGNSAIVDATMVSAQAVTLQERRQQTQQEMDRQWRKARVKRKRDLKRL